MSTFTDEQLSAFLDDALGPHERAELADALVDNAALAERLERLRGADEAFAKALSSIDDRPLPVGLEALLNAADEPADLPLAASLQPANDNRPWQSIAASVALVVAFAAGGLLNPFGESEEATVVDIAGLASNPAVQSMLESAPSGSGLELANGLQAEVHLSFLGTSGDYCREFALGNAQNSTVAIACREGAQNWDVVLAAAGPAMTGSDLGYSTASDASAAFDAAVGSLMASESANIETERGWIENQWKAER